MSKINDLIVTESENYLSALLAEKLPSTIIFHNFYHAIQVKKYAETIGEHSGLSAEEMNILRICALFHDSGYVKSSKKYIEESISLASAFLAEHGIDQQTIDYVSEIIGANKLPQNPKDKIAEVLCDADLMYIASENGIEQFDLLYDETVLVKKNFDKRSAFEKANIDYFTTHTYFTEYGKTILQPKKESAAKRVIRAVETT